MATAGKFSLHGGDAPSAPNAGKVTVFASGTSLYSINENGGISLLQSSGYVAGSGLVTTLGGTTLNVDYTAVQASGNYAPSGVYVTQAAGDVRYALSGLHINALGNVDLATIPLASGHHLGFDGTNWVPSTAGGGGGATTLTITSSGQVETTTLIEKVQLSANDTLQTAAIPAEYDHLKLRMRVRSTDSTNSTAEMRFNGDLTSANYRRAILSASAVSIAYGEDDAENVGWLNDSDADANDWTYIEGTILDYRRTDMNKQFNYTSHARTTATTHTSVLGCMSWESTATLSGIQIQQEEGDRLLVSGSWLEVYGIRSNWVVKEGTFGSATIKDGMIVP